MDQISIQNRIISPCIEALKPHLRALPRILESFHPTINPPESNTVSTHLSLTPFPKTPYYTRDTRRVAAKVQSDVCAHSVPHSEIT